MFRKLLATLAFAATLVSGPALAAISLLGADTNGTTGQTSRTIPEIAGTAQNDVEIVFCQASITTTLTWTDPADFTQIDTTTHAAGNPDQQYYLGYKRRGATAGDTMTFSHNDTANQIVCTLVTYRGVDTSAALDVTYSNASHYKEGTNNAPNITAKAITTNTNNAWVLIFTGITQQISGTAGAPSGYTVDKDSMSSAAGARGQMIVHKEKTTAGTETPGAFTHTDVNNTADPVSFTIALKPSGATAAAFTDGPTLDTPTTTTLPITFTSDTTGTVKGAACANGNAGNAAETLAGQCSGGGAALATISEAVTANVADGATFTALSPSTIYDLSFVIDAATDSAKASIADATTADAPVTAGITFFWRAEGTTLNATHDFSAGDTTASGTNGPSISATAAKKGSNGILTSGASSRYAFDSASIVNKSHGSMSCWTQWKTTVPTAGISGCMELRNTGDTNMEISINPAASQEFKFRIKSGAGVSAELDTTSVNAAIDTWYYVLVRWDTALDKRRISVYDTDLNLIETVFDGTTDLASFEPSTINEIQIGNTGTNANAIWVDNVFISDDYDAPINDFGNITSFGPTFAAGPTEGTIGSTTAQIFFTADQNSTIVGVACPNGQTASRAQVLAHNCSGGAAVDFFEEVIVGGVADANSFAGLSASTIYDTFFELTSTIGGPGQAQGSVANVTTTGSGATNPVFDAGPVVISQTALAYTIQYDASAAANDIFCGAYLLDATAPTATQVELGTNAHGTATEAATGSLDTITLIPDDADVLPGYDLYCILKKTTGPVRSAVSPMLDQMLDPPSGRQYVIKTGSPSIGELGLFDDASPAIASDDIMDAPLYSDSFEQGTQAHIFTLNNDTTYAVRRTHDSSDQLLPAPDDSRQSVNRRFYDRSAAAWSDSTAVRYYINNHPPRYAGRNDPEVGDTLLFEKGVTLNEVLDTWWVDDEGDAITHSITNIPAGGAVTGGELLTGSFTTFGYYSTVVLHATDAVTDVTDEDVEIIVGGRLPDVTQWLREEDMWKEHSLFAETEGWRIKRALGWQ